MIVDLAARTAIAQPGCLLGDVGRATQLHGLATTFGFFSVTGVAGLTLGGGFGYLARRFGRTVDNLLEVEIVMADGRLLRASRDEHEDLSWGVRGASANLGAVTRFTYRPARGRPDRPRWADRMAVRARRRRDARIAVSARRPAVN